MFWLSHKSTNSQIHHHRLECDERLSIVKSISNIVTYLISNKFIYRPLPNKTMRNRNAIEVFRNDRGRKFMCNCCLTVQRAIHFCFLLRMFVNQIEANFRILGGPTFASVARRSGYEKQDLCIDMQMKNKVVMKKRAFDFRNHSNYRLTLDKYEKEEEDMQIDRFCLKILTYFSL